VKLQDQNMTQTLFQFNEIDKAIIKLETKTKVIWVEHDIPNKKGNIRHFLGSSDGDVVLSGKLLGSQSDKSSNKSILRNLALNGTVLYFDTEGYETDLDGRYVITEIDVPEQGGEPWDLTIVLTEYNN